MKKQEPKIVDSNKKNIEDLEQVNRFQTGDQLVEE
jgi:hypothetical protein